MGIFLLKHRRIQSGRQGILPHPPPGKSLVAIVFIRKSGTDPLKKQLDAQVQLLLEGGPLRHL